MTIRGSNAKENNEKLSSISSDIKTEVETIRIYMKPPQFQAVRGNAQEEEEGCGVNTGPTW